MVSLLTGFAMEFVKEHFFKIVGYHSNNNNYDWITDTSDGLIRNLYVGLGMVVFAVLICVLLKKSQTGRKRNSKAIIEPNCSCWFISKLISISILTAYIISIPFEFMLQYQNKVAAKAHIVNQVTKNQLNFFF